MVNYSFLLFQTTLKQSQAALAYSVRK